MTAARPDAASLGWPGILRLGLVQAMLGAIVVLVTVTMNRVMVVELRLPAILPASLVALHYAVQVIRPAMGHGSDQGGRRTPWILGGMAALALGAILAAEAIILIDGPHHVAGMALAVLAYLVIGGGVGSSGTALLTLLGQRVSADRRPAAASTVWIMMIAGIAITAGTVSHLLQPFSVHRLLTVTTAVALLALVVTRLATLGIEPAGRTTAAMPRLPQIPLSTALRQVWQDPAARRFTGFVALSMLAYSAEEILLEPFAGSVFRMAPGQTAQLTGLQHAGALLGMLLVAVSGARRLAPTFRGMLPSLRGWTVGGCLVSAASLALLALAGTLGQPALLHGAVLALGIGNGTFAVAAIGSMMRMASAAGPRGGVRIGLWGAAQALAFALGGLGAATATDLARTLTPVPGQAYGLVLLAEAALFLLAARQAIRVFTGAGRSGTAAWRGPLPRTAP